MLLPERHRELGGAWRSADRAQLNLGAAQGDVGVEEHRLECSPPLSSPLLSSPLPSPPLLSFGLGLCLGLCTQPVAVESNLSACQP